MTHLLKANEARQLNPDVAFNFEDLRQRCDDYVEKTRQRTREMLEQAHAEAADIRTKAEQEGQKSGYELGMVNAQTEIQKRAQQIAEQTAGDKLKTMIPAIQEASDKLVREHDSWVAAWEKSAIRLSVAIAEKLVRHRLEVDPQRATDMTAAALKLASGSPHVTLKMNPHDIDLMGEQRESFIQSFTGCGTAELISDETISRGGCIVETQHGVINAQLEKQLERIMSELIEYT